ncbi:hypothetical protein PLICRDRAFT_40137 [Plicaturopsis crispa FD-325 SS-3]|nr:hypothetical protein PLICRDRAFT_40137 [Plicaturopsis crispa FD-325 SS-3]
MVLYGLTTLQAYFYSVHYTKDSRALKLLVLGVWLLDTLHVSFVGHAMYHYLVSSFGNPVAFVDGIWSLYSSMLVNLVMAIVVQSFFAMRIHHLCQSQIKWYLTTIILLIVFLHFCFGMETAVEFFIIRRLDKLQDVTFIAVLPFGITAVLSDIIIAVALCILLASNRSEFEVIVFTLMPNSFYTLAIDFIIGKLYANSLLATLNSRTSLRQKLDEGSSAEGTTTSFRVATARTAVQTESYDLTRMGALSDNDTSHFESRTEKAEIPQSRRFNPIATV